MSYFKNSLLCITIVLMTVSYAMALDGCKLANEQKIPGGRICEGTCAEPDGLDRCAGAMYLEACGCNPEEGYVRSPIKGEGCIDPKDCPKII